MPPKFQTPFSKISYSPEIVGNSGGNSRFHCPKHSGGYDDQRGPKHPLEPLLPASSHLSLLH